MRYWNHCAQPAEKRYTQRMRNYHFDISSARPEDSSEFLAAFERRDFEGMRNARDLYDRLDLPIGRTGFTPLDQAIKQRDLPLIEFLIKLGIDLRDKKYEKLLLMGIRTGDLDIVKLLVKYGADISGSFRIHSLPYAAGLGHVDIVNFLLDEGVDINAENIRIFPSTALGSAIENGQTPVVKLLIQRGASLDNPEGYDNPLLIMAASNGHSDIVDILLDMDEIKIDQQDGTGHTALVHAILHSNTNVVDQLLNKGASTTIVDDSGRSVLQLAAGSNGTELGILDRLLIRPGFPINHQDNYGRTALMSATQRSTNPDEVINRLIDVGSLVNLIDVEGKTALMIAAENGNLEAVQALLRRGANPSIKDHQGNSASQLVKSGPSAIPIIRLLDTAIREQSKLSHFGSCYC